MENVEGLPGLAGQDLEGGVGGADREEVVEGQLGGADDAEAFS